MQSATSNSRPRMGPPAAPRWLNTIPRTGQCSYPSLSSPDQYSSCSDSSSDSGIIWALEAMAATVLSTRAGRRDTSAGADSAWLLPEPLAMLPLCQRCGLPRFLMMASMYLPCTRSKFSPSTARHDCSSLSTYLGSNTSRREEESGTDKCRSVVDMGERMLTCQCVGPVAWQPQGGG